MPSNKRQKVKRLSVIRTERLLKRLAVLSCSIASSAMGQSVLAPLPTFPGQPVIPPTMNAANMGITTGAAAGTETVPEGLAATVPGTTAAEELFAWAAVHVKTHVTYQLLYGTGIQSGPGQSQGTITQTLNPGVTIALGTHWVLDYEPSLQFYSNDNFHNAFEQQLALVGSTKYGNWSFGLSQAYTQSDQPTVQTASQTGIQSYSAGVNAAYAFNDKVSLEMGAGVSLSFVDGTQIGTNGTGGALTNTLAGGPLSDSQSYFGSQWINYQLDPAIALAVGVSGGYTDQDGGLTTADEQYLGRVVFRPGTKLTISADGGVEDRQFLNSSQPETWTPIFDASAAYHLFEPTTLTLGASRSVQASLFQNQLSDSTAVSVGLQQRLLGKLQLSLGYSYVSSDYIGAQPGIGERNDVGNSYSARLGMAFLKHGTIATFYGYSENSSNAKGFSYSSNQVGMSLSWAY